MSLFFFVYTTIILIICCASSSILISTFLVTHSRRYLFHASFFIAYFLELAQIFGGEWLQQNLSTVDATNYYTVDQPIFRILIGAIILASFWATIFNMIDVLSWRAVLIPSVLIIIAQSLILYFGSYGPLTQWLFYSMRQVSLAACLLVAFFLTNHSHDEVLKTRLKRRKKTFLILCVCILAIFIEDSYIILIAPVPNPHSTFAGLFLSSRNFSENVMMLYLAWLVTSEAISLLRLRYNQPPTAEAHSKDEELLNNHIKHRMDSFAATHSLSEREAQILSLALQGRSNREIASELILAEGTIKTHLHNVMKKCEVSSREELKQHFWAS